MGAPGVRVLVEGSVDLVRWIPVAELTNPTGQLEFSDPDAARYPQRFYRGQLLE